jgi:hypothetical protein
MAEGTGPFLSYYTREVHGANANPSRSRILSRACVCVRACVIKHGNSLNVLIHDGAVNDNKNNKKKKTKKKNKDNITMAYPWRRT